MYLLWVVSERGIFCRIRKFTWKKHKNIQWSKIGLGGSSGLVVKGGDSESCEFESRQPDTRWTFFHINLLQNLHCLFEKTGNKRKRGRGWPIFNKIVLLLGGFRSWRPKILASFCLFSFFSNNFTELRLKIWTQILGVEDEYADHLTNAIGWLVVT